MQETNLTDIQERVGYKPLEIGRVPLLQRGVASRVSEGNREAEGGSPCRLNPQRSLLLHQRQDIR